MSSAPTTVEDQFYSVGKITKPDQTQTSQLRLLNSQTGTYEPVADLAFTTYAITRDEPTGRVYYVETGWNGRVAYWDPTTKENKILDNRTGASDEFLKLAQAKDGTIYGLGYVTTDLYVLDTATGKMNSQGTITGGTIPFTGGSGDIAFDPSDPNRLFVITTTGASGSDPGFYRLYTVNLTTRQATFVGETGLKGGDGSGSLGFVNGKLYASSGESLYELNLTTAQPTLVHNLGYITNDFATLTLSETREPGKQPDNVAPDAKDLRFSNLVPGTTLNVTGVSAIDADPQDAIVSYTITSLPPVNQGRLYLGNPAQGGTLVTQGQVLQPDQIQQLFFQTTSKFKQTSFEYTATSGTGSRQLTDATPAVVSFTAQECQGCCPIGEIITGDGRNNRINGSRMSDVIRGKGGRDVLRGHDCHDDLDGGRGKDRAMGGSGNDVLHGRRNQDRLRGGDGRDYLYGNLGKDRLRGGNDRDWMSGGRGDDWLQGNRGGDRLRGRRNSDKILGGTGNDRLFGNGNKDVLHGNRGRDVLRGGLGDDRLAGGRNRDVLVGFRGDDTLKGGSRGDRFVYTSLNDGVDQIVDFEASRDRIDLHRVFNRLGIGAKDQSAFVEVVQVGADSHLQIDANGAAPGFQAQTAFVLQNFTASSFTSKNLSNIGFNQ